MSLLDTVKDTIESLEIDGSKVATAATMGAAAGVAGGLVGGGIGDLLAIPKVSKAIKQMEEFKQLTPSELSPVLNVAKNELPSRTGLAVRGTAKIALGCGLGYAVYKTIALLAEAVME